MAKIILNRDSGYADRLRAYHVVIDDKKTAKISNGANLEIIVEPGSYELFLKIDWCRSNKIKFSISENEIKEFNCGSNLRGIKFIFAIVYATILWNRYIWLKETLNKSTQPVA